MQGIGLIGLGAIGRYYGINLLKHFGKVTVYDIDEKRVRDLERLGASPARSARGVGEVSDVVVLALPSPRAVEAAMLGPEGLVSGAKKGAVIVDLSTVGPDTSLRMAEEAERRGAYYLDAPVSGGAPKSGGTEGARKANVTFMVGGDRKGYEKALPVMEALGRKFFYLGPSGTGSIVKLLSNMVNGVIAVSVAEAFALGAAAGIDPMKLIEVFDETDADSYYLQNYLAPRFTKKNFEPGFAVELQCKDHRLASDLARRHGVPLMMNEVALQLFQMASKMGFSGKDYTAITLLWEKMAGAKLYR